MNAVVGIWGAVPIALLQDERITHAALKTYAALASFQGTKDECFPGIEDIAERAGMSERSVMLGMQVLRECDWISSRRRGLGKTNVYRVKMAVETQADASLETQDSALPEVQTSALQEVQAFADPLILSSPNLSSPSENTTRKQPPAVAGPGHHAVLQGLERLHGQQYTNYKREGKALKDLLDRVGKMFPGKVAGDLVLWMGRYLHSLRADKFWKTVPVSPSSLLSHWDRLYTMARAKSAETSWMDMPSVLPGR